MLSSKLVGAIMFSDKPEIISCEQGGQLIVDLNAAQRRVHVVVRELKERPHLVFEDLRGHAWIRSNRQ